MLRGPFRILAGLLLPTIVCPFFLPLGILGYPVLIAIGVWFIGRWFTGRIERPAGVAAVWSAYLGLILILHGIAICFDTAMTGPPPTIEEKRFGTRLAYLGSGISGLSVIAAYALDLRQRAGLKGTAGEAARDDLLA